MSIFANFRAMKNDIRDTSFFPSLKNPVKLISFPQFSAL